MVVGALQPDDAGAWVRLGQSLVRVNGGAVTGDAEAAFRRALEIDPGQGSARYFLGDAALARGDAATAGEMWAPLIAAMEPGDADRAQLQARLAGAGS